MIRLHLIRLGHPARPADGFKRWLFLGKNPDVEAACAAAMPDHQRIDVADRLRDIADRIRPEFAREVARIGALQKDIPGWCASTFAWKHPDVSDLFLMSCQRLLIHKLAVETSEPTLIFLEDSWLYESCRQDARLALSADPTGPVSLRLFAKAWLLLRGVAGRVIWICRVAAAWTRQRLLARTHAVMSGKSECYIYSAPHARCFGPDAGWNDPFFPGLEAMITRAGGRVRRLVPTGAYGFEREIARRSDFAHPLILDATPWDIITAFTTVWRGTSLTSYALGGVRMPLLAEREWWTDAGSARWCEYRLFNACFRRFLARERPATIIYPYENQPWEKLINLASSSTTTVTVGYQHSVVPPLFLSFLLGPEGPGTPLPDHILASSPLLKEKLIEAGTPPEKIRVGGSLRFRYLASLSVKSRRPRSNNPRRILLLGTHTPVLTRGILKAVRSAFPDGGTKDRLAFFFRPHPAAPPGALRLAGGLRIVNGDLAAQLEEFDLVVAMGSTAVLEAAFLGVPVILFRPATGLDVMDLGNMVPNGFIEHATGRQMRDQILRRLLAPGDSTVDAGELCDSLFSPVDEKAWLGCLLEKTVENK